MILPQTLVMATLLELIQLHFSTARSWDIPLIRQHHVVLLLACHIVADTFVAFLRRDHFSSRLHLAFGWFEIRISRVLNLLYHGLSKCIVDFVFFGFELIGRLIIRRLL